jgi:hypothetical protein
MNTAELLHKKWARIEVLERRLSNGTIASLGVITREVDALKEVINEIRNVELAEADNMLAEARKKFGVKDEV